MPESLLLLTPVFILTYIIYKIRKHFIKKNEEMEYLISIKDQLIQESKQRNNVVELEQQIQKENPQMTKPKVMATLNFMLQHNIIDHNEYNTLMIKSLPYTKG